MEISVEVVYAAAFSEKIIRLTVDSPCTIETIIERSGILLLYPEIDLSKNSVGIFSKKHELHDHASDGDRIEIYRPLLIDPKEARRKRNKK